MANRGKLIIVFILVAMLIAFGFLAYKAITAIVDLSSASLAIAGVETDASFNMVPVKITGLSANTENGTVELSWRGLKKTKLNGYRIYRGINSATENIIGSSNFPVFVDRSAESGKTYYYRVSAVNDLGEGYASSPVMVTVE